MKTEKISEALDFAWNEASQYMQNNLMIKVDGTGSECVLQNVVSTMLNSKLLAQDVKLFTGLVADMWSRYNIAINVDTSVLIQCIAGQPTDKSQILDGK